MMHIIPAAALKSENSKKILFFKHLPDNNGDERHFPELILFRIHQFLLDIHLLLITSSPNKALLCHFLLSLYCFITIRYG